MLYLYVRAVSTAECFSQRWRQRGWRPLGRDQRGQASAEYALVLLGAAAIALMVVAWAAKSGLVGNLLDTVLGKITNDAGAGRPPTTAPRP